MGSSLFMMADFQNYLISRIVCVFEAVFFNKQL